MFLIGISFPPPRPLSFVSRLGPESNSTCFGTILPWYGRALRPLHLYVATRQPLWKAPRQAARVGPVALRAGDERSRLVGQVAQLGVRARRGLRYRAASAAGLAHTDGGGVRAGASTPGPRADDLRRARSDQPAQLRSAPERGQARTGPS
jgi:hypothetical protein